MTWFVTSANELEAAKEHYFPFLAADFDFPSAHYRLWTGAGDLTLSGNSYFGAGQLVKVELESETSELNAQRVTFSLSNVDPSSVDEDDIDGSFGRSVILYLGFLNVETRALLTTPETLWEGRIDSFRRSDGSLPLIEVVAEHRLALLDRTDGWRYTHEHQQQFYAGDNGLNLVNTIALRKVLWGGYLANPGVNVPGTANPKRQPKR
jgi:hypothetical protein